MHVPLIRIHRLNGTFIRAGLSACAIHTNGGSEETGDVAPRYWVRLAVNTLNGSTLLGLVAALVGRARLTRGPEGLLLGWGYRFRVPLRRTPAFTLGNVVLLRARDPQFLRRRSTLLTHEARHATQYACCLGVVMVVLYLLASAWSWFLTGDPASRNIFERLAGLADGGYRERPLRPFFARATKRPPAPPMPADRTAVAEVAATPSVTPAGNGRISGTGEERPPGTS
jgi:hypothetical protein